MSFAGTSPGDDVFGDVRGGVGTITLNRPDRRNAMSTAMISGLADLLRTMESSNDVGAIVLTGAGNAFCAGGDVQKFDADGGEGGGATEVDPEAVRAQRVAQLQTVGRIYRCDKPVLASLPGAAAGAGIGFALAADLRIGSSRALFATAFAAVGLSGDFGVAWLLERIVGPAKARELMFLNPRISAEEAKGLSLLNWVVSEDELEARTFEIAEQLANGPRLALAHMKRNLLGAEYQDLEASMEVEVPRHKETGLSDDHIGAIAITMNTMATVREIGYIVQDADVSMIIAWHEDIKSAREAATAEDVAFMTIEDGARNFDEPPLESPREVGEEDTAVILYTSGTTGQPKGAELTASNLISTSGAFMDLLELDADDRFGTGLPLFHVFGQAVVMNSVLRLGASLSLLHPFDPAKMLQMMMDDVLTAIAGVPTMWNAMLHASEDYTAEDFKNLRSASSGGASLPGEVVREFNSRFGCVIKEGYGLAETCGAATTVGVDRERLTEQAARRLSDRRRAAREEAKA